MRYGKLKLLTSPEGRAKLKRLTESGEITSFDKRTMEVLSKEVIVYLAEKYKKVKRGIGDIMCGPMIETDARMLVNKGIEMGEKIGEKKGEKKGRQNGIISAIKAMEMLRNNEPEEKIIKQTGLSKEELDKLREQYR